MADPSENVLVVPVLPLAKATLLYLTLPIFIFFIGYLNAYLAISLVLLLLGSVRSITKHSNSLNSKILIRRPSKTTWGLIGFGLFIWLVLSGVGQYGLQDSDWLKHNAILRHLVDDVWPVSLDYKGQDFYLVYYTAYLLPASIVGKVFGLDAAHHFLFVWTAIGVVIAFLWFCLLVEDISAQTLIIFVLFSGLDALGIIILQNTIPYGHIEWWANYWQYSSMTSLLYWVPNQAIPGWIFTAIILFSQKQLKETPYFLLYLSLSLLWSPWITLGLAPLVVVFVTVGKQYKQYINFPNFVGIAISIIFVSYYATKTTLDVDAVVPDTLQFIFSRADHNSSQILQMIYIYLLFIFLEVWIYVLVLGYSVYRSKGFDYMLLVISASVLTLIPILHYGQNNDLVMRSSIPALFGLLIVVSRAMRSDSIHIGIKSALIILIAVASITPANEILRHTKGTVERERIWGSRWSGIEHPDVVTLQALDRTLYENRDGKFFSQYIGSKDGFFWQTFAQR